MSVLEPISPAALLNLGVLERAQHEDMLRVAPGWQVQTFGAQPLYFLAPATHPDGGPGLRSNLGGCFMGNYDTCKLSVQLFRELNDADITELLKS